MLTQNLEIYEIHTSIISRIPHIELRQPKIIIIELPPVDKIPGRMALLVTTFLMLVNISSTERNKGPVVSCMEASRQV